MMILKKKKKKKKKSTSFVQIVTFFLKGFFCIDVDFFF